MLHCVQTVSTNNSSFKERVKTCFSVAFNNISQIFREKFIEIPYAFQEIRKMSLSVLAIFIDSSFHF